MPRVLIIDDDQLFLQFLRDYVAERCPDLVIETCLDPIRCLGAITPDLDLLLVDLEMPGIDGSKILAYATDRGLDRRRVIILSGRDADYLHQRFPMGSCLAVLNKHDARQKAVLDMVFKSLQQKCRT
jgi:CheY-like chemotaxis protein